MASTLLGGNEIVLATQLENGTVLYWRLTRGVIEQISEPAAGSRVFGFCSSDYRIQINKTLGSDKANSVIVRASDVGERMRIVNHSSRRPEGAIYGVPSSHLVGMEYTRLPGLQVLDRLIRQHGKKAPLIAGFYFQGENQSLAILACYREAREGRDNQDGFVQHALLISVNPSSPQHLAERIIPQFAANNKFPNPDQPLIFSGEEFLGVAGSVESYPDEDSWNGFPYSTLALVGMLVTASVAFGSLGWAGYNYVAEQAALNKTKEAKQKTSLIQKEISEVLVAHPNQFAANMSLNEFQVFRWAEQIWQPNTRISFESDRNKAEYKLFFNSKPATAGLGAIPKAFAFRPTDQVKNVIDMKAPDGCEKKDVLVKGDLDSIQISLSCAFPKTDFSRFRGD